MKTPCDLLNSVAACCGIIVTCLFASFSHAILTSKAGDPCYELSVDKYYRLYNRGTGMFASEEDGKLFTRPFQDIIDQKFELYLHSAPDNKYSIRAMGNLPSRGIQLPGGQTTLGGPIGVGNNRETTKSFWFISNATDGFCMLKNQRESRVMDTRAGGNAEVERWDYIAADPNQEWIFVPFYPEPFQSKTCTHSAGGYSICVYSDAEA